MFIIFAGVLAVLGTRAPARAQEQQSLPPPYASLGAQGASYWGPGREAAYDLAGPTIRIGLLVPLRGPQKTDGAAIVRAAEMALDDDARNPLPGGFRLALAVEDESGPTWGQVADAIIHLVLDEQVVAVVASANGGTTHLSAQVGNRIGVPVLTLSTDKTTTEINLPWIFRMGPSDTLQARAIAESICRDRGFRRVLLVAEHDHDGHLGGDEFQAVARQLHAPPPTRVLVDPLQPDAGSMLTLIRTQSPEAIVFWTRSQTTRKLLQEIRADGISTPVYLSQEAAQVGAGVSLSPSEAPAGEKSEGAGIWTVASGDAGSTLGEGFARRYFLLTGEFPGPVAAEAYDAVRLIVRALRDAGPNRARVRDQIAGAKNLSGVSGTISFDNEGNNRTSLGLVRLR